MPPLYHKLDFIIMLAKIIVPASNLIYYFGWFYGLILNYGCWTAYYWVLSQIFNKDRLFSLDEFFLLDNQKNRANIMTVIKTDKMPDGIHMREVIIKLALVHPRLSHNLQKFMGEYFFCKMTGENLEKAIKERFVFNHEIKSDDDIANFLAKEQIIRDPLDTFQYKITFVPEFSQTESCLILKMHHCLADGVTTMAVTSTLTDEGYNVNNFPRLIPRLSLIKKIGFSFFQILMMPYSIYLAQKAVLNKGSNNEIFPEGSELIGKRKVAFSKPLEIGELKDVLKKRKISLNDYICVTAQLALAQIAVNTEKMQVSIPITLKDYPDSLKSIKIGNEFAALPFQFNFPRVRDLSSFKQMLEQQKQQVGAAKNLCLGLGFYYMMNYFVSVLRYKMCNDWKRICSNYTAVFSCVPGPKNAWSFEGLKVRQIFYIVPGAGALGCGIGVITQNDKCQVSVGCDQVYFPDDTHKTFIQKFEEIFTRAVDYI